MSVFASKNTEAADWTFAIWGGGEIGNLRINEPRRRVREASRREGHEGRVREKKKVFEWS